MNPQAADVALELVREAGLKTIVTRPGMGTITTLVETFSDNGLDAVEFEAFRIYEMSDLQLSAALNDALLSDKVVIFSGFKATMLSLSVEARRAVTYLLHAFAERGGRAVVVAY